MSDQLPVDNAIDIQPTPEMGRVIRKVDEAIQRLWHADPAAALIADEIRERVADLEVLLPTVALHADEFEDLDLMNTPEDFRALYKGFALHALVVMIDARNLWISASVASFLRDLEQISADVYELRKYVDGLDREQRNFLAQS